MPLDDSCSLEAYKSNIAEMVKAGHPQAQAVAAAANMLRKVCGASRADQMLAHVEGSGVVAMATIQERLDKAIALKQSSPKDTALLRAMVKDVETCGDVPGHEFHGNQHTGGGGATEPQSYKGHEIKPVAGIMNPKEINHYVVTDHRGGQVEHVGSYVDRQSAKEEIDRRTEPRGRDAIRNEEMSRQMQSAQTATKAAEDASRSGDHAKAAEKHQEAEREHFKAAAMWRGSDNEHAQEEREHHLKMADEHAKKATEHAMQSYWGRSIQASAPHPSNK